MSIIFVISMFFGSILGMFVAWRRLREDYVSKLIFNTLFVVLIYTYFITFFTYLLTKDLNGSAVFIPTNLWFWSGFFTFMLTVVYVSKKYRIKLNELFNNLVLTWIVILMIGTLSVNYYYSVFFLVLMLVYLYVDANYLKYNWYVSGKIGFSGLFLFALFFGARAIVVVVFTDIISIIGKVDFIFSAIIAFLSAFSLYNIGKK